MAKHKRPLPVRRTIRPKRSEGSEDNKEFAPRGNGAAVGKFFVAQDCRMRTEAQPRRGLRFAEKDRMQRRRPDKREPDYEDWLKLRFSEAATSGRQLNMYTETSRESLARSSASQSRSLRGCRGCGLPLPLPRASTRERAAQKCIGPDRSGGVAPASSLYAREPSPRMFDIFFFQLDAEIVAPTKRGGDQRRARTGERIEHERTGH